MKRLLVALLLSMLLPAGGDDVFAAGKNLKISMVLWRGETDAEKGFRDGLKELGYSVQYTEMNAGQDRAELGRLLREDLKPRLDSVDYVYVYGTTVTLAAKSIVQDKTPVIFNIVADPVGAGVARSMESSGGNIAGVGQRMLGGVAKLLVRLFFHGMAKQLNLSEEEVEELDA